MVGFDRKHVSWMTFRSSTDEAAFKKMLEPQVYTGGAFASFVAGLGYFITAVARWSRPLQDITCVPDIEAATAVVRGFQLGLGIASFSACLLLLGSRWIPNALIRLADGETIVSIWCCVVFACAPFTGTWIVAVSMGCPQTLPGTDVSAWMSMMVLASFLALYVPVRSMYLALALLTSCVSRAVVGFVVGSPSTEKLPFIMIMFVSHLLFCFLGARWRERLMRDQFWTAGQLEGISVTTNAMDLELKRRYMGVTKLLTLLCDCLVHVDANDCLIEPSRRFAALLLYKPGETLLRKNFCDLIFCDEDRTKYQEALRRTRHSEVNEEQHMGSGVLSLRFRDANGSSVAVHAYHTHISTVNVYGVRVSRHLIGITENQERDIPDADLEQPQWATKSAKSEAEASQSQQLRLHLSHAPDSTLTASSGDLQAACADKASENSLSDPAVEGSNSASECHFGFEVYFNAFDSRFGLIEEPETLKSVLGVSASIAESIGVLDWLKAADESCFRVFTQNYVIQCISNDRFDPSETFHADLVFPQVKLRVEIMLDCLGVHNGEGLPRSCPMKASFQIISRSRRTSANRIGRGTAPSAPQGHLDGLSRCLTL